MVVRLLVASSVTGAANGQAAEAPTVLGVSLRWLLGAALVLACGAIALAWLSQPARPALGGDQVCGDGAPLRRYSVSLINIPIVLNRFGDVMPQGRMYVLDENIEIARTTWMTAADPFNPQDVIEPLVLRANKGDCVEISFTNRLNEPPPPLVPREDLVFSLPGQDLQPALSPIADPLDNFNPAITPPASMHFTGLAYDVNASDGTAAGFNASSVAEPGQTTIYRLSADEEGEYLFQNGADLSAGSTVFGTFGAIAVEPEGSQWRDPVTDQPLRSGTSATIIPGQGKAFREFVAVFHDELEAQPGILTRFCGPPDPAEPEEPEEDCVEPTPEQEAILGQGALLDERGEAILNLNDGVPGNEAPVELEWVAINYRSEPMFNRAEEGCTRGQPLGDPDAGCDSAGLSSWVHGEPGGGDLIFHSYRNEPTRMRLLHGGTNETHSFHWHINRWPNEPNDEGGLDAISSTSFTTPAVTNPIDVQAIGPGTSYDVIPEGGAGSQQGSFGDIIFHCHLYPHFDNGMWGLNRVHDVLEDGSRTLPSGEPVLPLVPLPDMTPPEAPTEDRPGFPFFIPGEFGLKPAKPPLGVEERGWDGPSPPTELEQNAARVSPSSPTATPEAGAFFVNPCPPDAPRKRIELAVIQLDVEYNPTLQWHNPQHRMYVLQEDKEAVLSGAKPPEPFSPLLNVGECVQWEMTNELPVNFGGTVFDRARITDEVSLHQHMIHFDVLSGDGTINGWNYDQGADPGQTIRYQTYIQADVRTNSFHDHLFAFFHQDNGLFGGSTIHPTGCTYHDPTTGELLGGTYPDGAAIGKAATLVDVQCPGEDDDYRNFALFVEDHVPMFQPPGISSADDAIFETPPTPDGMPTGVPIFTPHIPNSHDDYGIIAVNYSAEPFEARRDADPADRLSSRVWGDPATPLLRAYRGDRISIDMFQISFEESHALNMHRWSWPFEPNDPASPIVQAQHISMLEYFSLEFRVDLENTNQDGLRVRDYLWNYGGMDDWFLGAWGIMRVYGCQTPAGGVQLPPGFNPKNPINTQPLHRLSDTPQGLVDCNLTELGDFARTPGNPAPSGAPVRRYDVVAMSNDTIFNEAGDHDPFGMMYVLAENEQAVRNGTKAPEPLVIRASQGDVIEVTLTNKLDPSLTEPHCFEALEPGQLGFGNFAPGLTDQLPDCLAFPPETGSEVPGFLPLPVSDRISLHPSFLSYDIGSDAANVGLNWDSTVGPGESITYRWFADREYGMALLQDRADVHHHLHHGAYGAIVIEPPGARYLDPHTGAELASGEQAVVIHEEGGETLAFREAVLLFNSDLSLFQADGAPVEDRSGGGDAIDDPEDQGEFSVNYRDAPFQQRLLEGGGFSQVFSSLVHGDPATPLVESYVDEPARLRVGQAIGKPRATTFTLHGHRWRRQPRDIGSPPNVTLQGQMNPGVVFDVALYPADAGSIKASVGAGGALGLPGDYVYRSNTQFLHLPGGQWGLFRVHAQGDPQAGTLIPLSNLPLAEGDASGDGAVTIADALLIAQCVAGLTGPCPTAGDVNDDGQITVEDALIVAQFVVGLIPSV